MTRSGILLLGVVLLTAGCATTGGPMYDWGNYSQSLYNLKKKECPESLEAHKETLSKIISRSKEKGLRVPPGVCCEYGYLLLREGRTEEGLGYMTMEEQIYPESHVFIERLKQKATPGAEPKQPEALPPMSPEGAEGKEGS